MKKLMKMVLSAWCVVLGAEATRAAELPAGYTAVEYIVAPAGSYVDTGYWPSDKTRVAMDVTVQGVREYWFGAWTNNWDNGVYALGNDNGEVYCGYGSGRPSCGGIKGPDGSGLPAGRVTVALEKGVVYTNGVVWSDAHSTNLEFTVNYNLYLFAQNRKGTAKPGDGQGDIICHGCTISEGSAVKRDFVPCYRTSDGKIGLYDLAEASDEAFYANAGKGEFKVPAAHYCTVTVGDYQHMTAAWTSGDGSSTNAISGGVFEVPKGTENVKVIFTADPAYEVVEGKLVHDIGTVNEDCAPEFGDLPQLVHRKVEYVDADGQLRTNDTFTVVTELSDKFTNGWYLVEGTVSRIGIDVLANCMANLILADGASLMVQGWIYDAGIDVRPGETLNIYGQREGTGNLTATGGQHGAGIGGGKEDSGGTVTVNGGMVAATGGDGGAGIGGGFNGTGGTVTVNGGTVMAKGGNDGAGIGGGWGRVGGTVTVNGGVVTATGGNNGAGIGGGYGGAGYKVTVNGGAVTATGGNDGAGIGGGQTGNGGTVTVNGGVVTATGGNAGAGIGGGRTGNGDKVTVEGGTVTATGNGGGAGIGGGYSGEDGKVELDKAKVRVVEGAYGSGSFYVRIADRDCWAIVTVGALPMHVASVAWTCEDGMTTNEIYGTGFAVPKGAEDVKVIYTADSGYSFADGAVAAEVLVGRVDADCTVTAPEVRMSEIETFGRGWYVTAPCGTYIDTYSKPDSNTRVEMEVLVGDISSKREYWFGCWTNSWDKGVFALGNDGTEVYCGYGSGDTCGGIKGLGTIPSGRVTVALEKGIVYTNCVVWSAEHESDAKFSLDRNLYLFAQNRAGTAKPGDGQERIVCYGCRISTNGVNGAAVPVRNFVPARTKDERHFVGLYDTVSGEFFAARGGMLTLEYDEDVANYAVVTVEGPLDHVAAAWTSGDGSVTNAFAGAFFEVRKGSDNVKVIFASVPGYSFAEGAVVTEVSLGEVSDDCAVTASEVRKSEIETFGLDWYVAATDGVYIDTGLKARSNTKIDADMQALDLTAQCGFFGTIGGRMNLAAYINGWNQFATCLGKVADYTASGMPADTERHRFVLDANKPGSFAIDGTNVTCLTDNVTADSKSKYPILIGARNQDGTAMPMNCRIFSFKINEGEILLRDFVPARTKDDGRIVGLYDTVSGEFFAARGGMLTLGYYDDPSRYAMVTVGELPEHVVSAAWTGGDGSETNAISDIFFRVLKGTENVKVIFTADPAYEAVEGKLVHDIGTVSEDCAPEFGNLPQFVHRRVGYVDENGRLLTNDTFAVVTELTDKFSNGWYLVEGTVTRGGIDLSENCTANLILADGASLTVTAADNGAGIDVRQGETLNIYGQRDGSGRLTATGGSSGVGIGGGEGGAGGKVTISGGWVWAEGQNAFGGDVTIRGEMAAFDVTDGEPGTLIARNDKLTSTGKILVSSSLRRVTVPAVENTTVSVATNGVPVEGFAGGDLDIPLLVKVTVDYTAVEGWWVFGTAHFETTVSGEVRLPAEGDEPTAFRLGYMAVEYVDEDGCLQTNETARIVTADTGTLESGWYVVTGEVSRSGIDVASGCTANLVLADGASLTAQGGFYGAGINVSLGETLNIYGQREGTGWLVATGGQYGAGIGGGRMGGNGTVTINGGTVSAQGGQWGAGIGGGYGGAGGKVTVNGGQVTAIGNDGGKGIGGGSGEGGGLVTINGGKVRSEGWDAFGEKITLGKNVAAYDITGGEPGTLITEELLLTSVNKILAVYDAPVGPTCEGGEIAWSDAANAWVVAPTGGVTAVAVGGLPDGDFVAVPPSVTKVSGVADAQIKVRSGAYDITGAFTVSGGVIALNPNGVVTIGGETIPVKPTILLRQGYGGQVGDSGVSVTMRAIPGLKYALKRTDSLRRAEDVAPYQTVAVETATGTRVTLTDTEPPKGGAFYRVVVRVGEF